MGLFDAFKKKTAGSARGPQPCAADEAPGVLCAPVTGRVIEMKDVPDPVFSGEVLGKGCAIWPTSETVYAPLSGEVTVVMGHAVGIKSDGLEVLVHIGVDTVDMNGKGFTGLVKEGDTVQAGQPLLQFSRKAIADTGHPDCVVLAVSNTADFSSVALVAPAESEVSAGTAVVRVTR